MADFDFQQSAQTIQELLNSIPGKAEKTEVDELRALYEALTQSDPVIIQPTDTWPVANPQENVIYRVIDRVNTPPQYYSDYMWNGTAMVLMATYNNAIDDEPTAGSNNLVKSGSVFNSLSVVNSSGIYASTAYNAYLKCTKTIKLDVPNSVANHRFCLYYFGLYAATQKFLIGIHDVTENKHVGYAFSEKVFNGNETGIEIIEGQILEGNQTSYSSSVCKCSYIIDWGEYDQNLFINDVVTPIFISAVNNKNIGYDFYSEDITCGSLTFNSSRKELLSFVKDLNVYIPNSMMDSEYYLTILGYEPSQGKMMIGFRDVTTNTQYYGVTSVFEKPESGVVTYGMFAYSNDFMYFNVIVDWSEYNEFINDEYGTGLYKDIKVVPQPLSLLDKITGQGLKIHSQVWTLDAISLNGNNVEVEVEESNSMIILNENASISGFTFNYIGQHAITSRTEMVDGHGNHRLEPIYTEQNLSDNDLGTIGSSASFIVINSQSGQCAVEDCVFKGFSKTVIYNMASGRHISANHSVIRGNMFYYCKIGIFLGEEFARCYENVFTGCPIGIYCGSSDISIMSCKFLRCDTGLYFAPNNDAYGIVCNCFFNHCGVSALYAHLITQNLGFNIVNSMIAQAPVICKVANKLTVSNCEVNSYFIIVSGSKNRIICNMMDKGYAAIDGVTDIFDVPQDTQITMNRGTGNDADYNWT